MAVGDKRTGSATLAGTQTFDIKPPSGEEWSLHNIYYGGTAYNATIGIDIVIVDGTAETYFDRDSTQGARQGLYLDLTNTHFIRLKNYTASNTFNVSYDGVQTK